MHHWCGLILCMYLLSSTTLLKKWNLKNTTLGKVPKIYIEHHSNSGINISTSKVQSTQTVHHYFIPKESWRYGKETFSPIFWCQSDKEKAETYKFKHLSSPLGSCYSIFSLMCMFCRSLFILFSFGHRSSYGFWLLLCSLQSSLILRSYF